MGGISGERVVEAVQGPVGIWQSWWMWGEEQEGGGDGTRQAEGGENGARILKGPWVPDC